MTFALIPPATFYGRTFGLLNPSDASGGFQASMECRPNELNRAAPRSD